jgi:hypothetical protein
MIPFEEMTDEQFEEHVLSVLKKDLGPYGMARYLRMFRTGSGDYTRDRHLWQDGLTVDDILKESGLVENRNILKQAAS